MESSPSSPRSRFLLQPSAVGFSKSSSPEITVSRDFKDQRPSICGMALPTISQPFRTGTPCFRILLLFLLSLLATTTSATLITSFTNCLSEDVQQSPTHLQFHPRDVDAIFDLSVYPYTLNITVYGYVTGRSSTDPQGNAKRGLSGLVVPGRDDGVDSPTGAYGGYETLNARRVSGDVSQVGTENSFTVHEIDGDLHTVHRRGDIVYETGGSIVQQDDGWNTEKQTTLQSKVNVLTFQLYNGYVPFCSNANACPMEPVKNTRYNLIHTYLVSQDTEHNLALYLKSFPRS